VRNILPTAEASSAAAVRAPVIALEGDEHDERKQDGIGRAHDAEDR